MSTSRSPPAGTSWCGQARREMLELVRTMRTGLCNHPEVETLILQLAQGLETVRGKKSYGCLPKSSPVGIRHTDHKLRRRERDKKIALGQKADDHEEYQGPTMSM